MGLRINTNVPVLAAQRTLENTTSQQSKTLEQLSSGQRIVSAGDDAAGLAIGSKLKAQISGMVQAKRSTNDGISLAQTAEGAMNEVSNILIRLRELGVQAASDTIGEQERGYIQVETKALVDEVDRISQSTQFNGINLLNGENSNGDLVFQVGANGGEENRISFDANSTDATASTLGISGLDLSDRDSAADSLASVDEAINSINSNRASLGALQNRLTSTSNNLGNMVQTFSAAKSQVLDTDYAQTAAQLTQSNILANAGISVLAQASNSPSQALKLL
jgi:flagellin